MALLGVATATCTTAAARSTAIPRESYLRADKLVAVDGRRRLNLRCLGTGQPTVMLESGLWDNSMPWRAVQGEIAKFTRVCAYDRAGLGFSDPGTRPATALNIVDDLHRLVAAAGIKLPIVLVGHSAGGLYVTVYAGLYPQEVAGMVLVDPTYAEEDHELMTRVMTAAEQTAANRNIERLINDMQACLKLAKTGELNSNTVSPANCLRHDPDPMLNAELVRESQRYWTQQALLSEAASFAVHAEGNYSESALEALRTPHDFKDMPLIVLTPGNTPTTPTLSTSTINTREEALKEGHRRLAHYSSAGQWFVVPSATHYIQLAQPQAVIDAVRAVVDAANERQSHHD